MTETNATLFPPGRYGRRRQPQRVPRWLVLALVAVVGLGLVGISYRLYRLYGVDDFSVTLTGYRDITDKQVVIDFVVTKPEDQTAVCLLRARNRAGVEVGRARVSVSTPGERAEISYTLATTGLPVGGETLGCSRQR